MARHRTAVTPAERRRLVLHWAGRAAMWLGLGVVVGLAAWGALAWAGSAPAIRVWVGLGAGILAAAAAGLASVLPPGPGHDQPGDGPSGS
jgi:hypothetical protein